MTNNRKIFTINISMDLYTKVEELSEKFTWSKSKVMRKTIENLLFLHTFMLDFMKRAKDPSEYVLKKIDEIEEMINVFKR